MVTSEPSAASFSCWSVFVCEVIGSVLGLDPLTKYQTVSTWMEVGGTCFRINILKRLKGRSSRKIQQEFPRLSKKYGGKLFWAVGYAAFSSDPGCESYFCLLCKTSLLSVYGKSK
ncbi:hypothetical protein DJ031_13600 [bacterium endosymbiont of Escarpia laminata]|nr:MAG: hypothetical protein DJ031_13600 [bacterium endosymbiont of Escarpia laminata]